MNKHNESIHETKRLLLKPTNEEDAEFILSLMNTPKWLQFIGDRNVKSIQDAIDYIKENIQPQFGRLGYGNFTVIRKHDGAKMGSCGLYDREGLDGVDIGFGFLPEFEKHGYAYEASVKIKQLAFETFKLQSIGAITDPENIASQKLLEKLGLKFIRIINLNDSDEDLMFYQLKKEQQ